MTTPRQVEQSRPLKPGAPPPQAPTAVEWCEAILSTVEEY